MPASGAVNTCMNKKVFLIVLSLFLLPLLAFAEEADELKIIVPRDIRGYQENMVIIKSEYDGLLTLEAADELNQYRTITEGQPIRKGETVVSWDGLGYNNERIEDGKYLLSASLTLDDGRSLTAASSFTMAKCRQAVVFALPVSDTMYQDKPWYAEVKLVRQGRLVTEFFRGDEQEPFYKKEKDISTYRILKWEWDGKISGEALPAGEYRIRFSTNENPGYAAEIRVTIAGEPEPKPAIAPTGPIMPERGASDREIWEFMMKPSVVVDIKNTSHQKVYASPNRSSAVLGTLHGQGQGLEIFEVLDIGWCRIGAWEHEDGAYVEGYVPTSVLKTVAPQPEYGLLLDKKAQTMTVYRKGEKLDVLRVSTGLITKNKLFRETAAGVFLTQEHMSDYSTNGKKFQYVIRYDGGNLLHAIAYQPVKGKKNYALQTATLGQKASNACVRIQPTPAENGLNAYWIWTHIPANTRVIILDDQEEREGQLAALGLIPAAETFTAEEAVMPEQPAETVMISAEPPSLEEGETELVLTVGGDAVIGTREIWWNEQNALPAYLDREGFAYPFYALKSLFDADDLTYVNLECVLKNTADGEDTKKQYRFRGLTAWTQVLAEAGIETVNIANNHFVDYGASGKKTTRKALEDAGIPYSGYGYTWIFEKDGHKIGFGGCRETIYRLDPGVIRRDVQAMRKAGCDAVVYSCHWGTEYSAVHNDLQQEMAAAAADAGVDIVVGAHPHVVQGIDQIGNTVVLYSLGNLMFGGTHEMITFDGLLCRLRLRFGLDGAYSGVVVEPIPILTSSSAAAWINDFRPVLAEGADRARIMAQIQADSRLEVSDAMFFYRNGRDSDS